MAFNIINVDLSRPHSSVMDFVVFWVKLWCATRWQISRACRDPSSCWHRSLPADIVGKVRCEPTAMLPFRGYSIWLVFSGTG